MILKLKTGLDDLKVVVLYWKVTLAFEGNFEPKFGLICGKRATVSFNTTTHLAIPRLKYPLRGKRFQDLEEIKRNAIKQLLAFLKGDFEECFRRWEDRCKKVVASKGECFEGDIITIDPN